jgi:broad-specificity NMP kinase
MKHQLKHGVALVISGPPGCGKSNLAREIAKAHGSFEEVSLRDLDSDFRIGVIYAREPKTVIVDGFPRDADARKALRHIVSSEYVVVNQKMKRSFEVKNPNYIFCSGDADPFNLIGHEERRFMVIRLGEET